MTLGRATAQFAILMAWHTQGKSPTTFAAQSTAGVLSKSVSMAIRSSTAEYLTFVAATGGNERQPDAAIKDSLVTATGVGATQLTHTASACQTA